MTTSYDGRSAEIYQFPLRGRFAPKTQHDEMNMASGISPVLRAPIVFGPTWYHEEAIRENDRARKR
jgi:hypothetical protein